MLGAITGGSYNLRVDARPARESYVPFLVTADGTTSSTALSMAARTATTTANRLFTLQGSIAAAVTGESALDVVYVEIFDRLNDANQTLVSLGKASVKAGNWYFTYTGSELVQGNHTLVVRAVDFAGNQSATDTELKASTATLTLNVNNASVTTEPADRIAPTLVGGVSYDGTEMTLTLSEPVQTTVPASAFAVAVNGQLVTISSVTVDTNDRTKLKITLAEPVYRGQQITLAYSDPSLNNDIAALQDDAGNDAGNFYVSSDRVSNLNVPSTPGTPDLLTGDDNFIYESFVMGAEGAAGTRSTLPVAGKVIASVQLF